MESILLTLRHDFDPFWVPSFGWSRSCWLWGASLFLAVDRSLTSRLWACWKLLLQIVHWHVIVCFRFSSFPLKWFPASKRSLWDQAFPCLGNGQHVPHVAPGFLLLPCCGWCWWAPLQVAWPLSATVVSPEPEFGILEPLKLRNQYFYQQLSFFPFFLEDFDYFWPCPLLSKQTDFSYFQDPKRQAFYKSM